MKILIDECLPKKLKRELPNHDVATVREKGWQGKKNGVLLRLMSGAFDVFITVDKNSGLSLTSPPGPLSKYWRGGEKRILKSPLHAMGRGFRGGVNA